jgi:hypothetical protein
MLSSVHAQTHSRQFSLSALIGTLRPCYLLRLISSDHISFLRTGQEDVLTASTDDLPAVLSGMRNVCAIASTLLGGAVTANGEITPTASSVVPIPTSAAITTAHDGILLGSIGMLFLTFALIIISSDLVMWGGWELFNYLDADSNALLNCNDSLRSTTKSNDFYDV